MKNDMEQIFMFHFTFTFCFIIYFHVLSFAQDEKVGLHRKLNVLRSLIKKILARKNCIYCKSIN